MAVEIDEVGAISIEKIVFCLVSIECDMFFPMTMVFCTYKICKYPYSVSMPIYMIHNNFILPLGDVLLHTQNYNYICDILQCSHNWGAK